MKSLARWGTLPLAAMPLSSWALTLGDIEAISNLNQPLNAEISLTATAEELSTLRVSLAPANEFLERGIEYPSFLTSVELEVTRNAAGENVIVVTSNEPVAEPIVTLVVQATHARGVSNRVYDVFLDPPLFLPPEASAEPIATPVTREAEPTVAGGPIERPTTVPAPAVAPAPVVQPETAPAVQPQAAPAVATASGTAADYTVQAGDTLWGIASDYRPAGVTMNQAMISIFEANPSAFQGNINRLRRGVILRIPPASELVSVTTAAATVEVQRQYDAWRNEVETTPELFLAPPGDDVVAGGSVGGNANDAAVEALEVRVADLEASLATRDAELEEARRLLQVRSEELADLQGQLDEAPTAVESETVPLDDLESEPLFVDETEPVAEDVEPEATVADSPAADAGQEPVATATEATEVSETPAAIEEPGPSLIGQVFGFLMRPIILILGIVAILLAAGIAFLRRRRSDADDVTGQWQQLEDELGEEADHSATAQILKVDQEPDMVVVEGHGGAAPDADDEFEGTAAIDSLGAGFDEIDSDIPGTEAIEALTDDDFDTETASEIDDLPESEPEPADQTMSSQTIINLDQADPIAEADFHMAYGLYDQAADLITKALEADPANRVLKIKLVEVYFVWGNKEQFLAAASDLREEIGQGADADWDKVVIMGKQICPDEPLFSEATTAAPEVDLALESSGVSPGLDFAFEGGGEEVDLDFGIVDDESLSLEEPTGNHAVAAEPAAAEPADQGDEKDEFLDIGERTQAGLKAAFFEEAVEGLEESADFSPTPEIEDFEATQETPSFEAEAETESADFLDGPTMEAPAFESEPDGFLDSPTMEGPMAESATLQAPTIETPAADDLDEEAEAEDAVEPVRLAAAGGGRSDMTAEIEIDDLGLDLGDLADRSDEFADLADAGDADGTQRFSELTIQAPDMAADSDQLSATGVTKVLDQPEFDDEKSASTQIGDDEATVMAPVFDTEVTGTSTEVLEQQQVGSFEQDAVATENDADLDFDDFSSALEGADTVERPAASSFSRETASAVTSDVGSIEELTGTTEIGPLDPQAMSEVGTKLDLARAYIDMGDPEGARSILEEVLNEGNDKQRSEAEALIGNLDG